ncbi:MAG: serine/threonine protein kinase [Labilithrix sp.]|nr:serine/threonine protein kinase [Labilithrix sp.]
MRPDLSEGSDDERAFLQRRVALFGLVGSTLGALTLGLSVAQSASEPGPVFVPAHALHALGLLGPLAAWLLARGAPRSVRFARILEASATVSSALCFHVMTMRFPAVSRPDLVSALATMQIVVIRAIIIPSTGLRTGVLSTVMALPMFAVAYATYLSFRTGAFNVERGLLDLEITALTWASLAVVTATFTSRVIYGLRRKVRDAQELGQYTLLQKLGEGGMGQVFRARHAMLRRPTAVKLLHSTSQDELARFEREVQLTAQLTHPNTVTVFDYGRTPDGVFYYAMELLDGADLQKLVERFGPMPPSRVIHVLSQVAAALAEAHGVGLIHRDIKPANIILCTRGTACDVAKVVDFGLVKRVLPSAEDSVVSAPELTVGTPLYIAPETLSSPLETDTRTDLYSLGAVGYFLLTGSPVFVGGSVADILTAHLRSKPLPPSTRLGHPVPRDLEAVLLDCLAKTPAERPADALALRERLLACADASGWTDADARAWWGANGAERLGPYEPVSSTAKTIAVDLDRRAAAS